MPPTEIAKRVHEVIGGQWQELLRLRREVLNNPEIESIHDLRVASRRFCAVLNLFEPWLPVKNCARLKKHVRKLTQMLSALRNIDEAQLFFRLHNTFETVRGSRFRDLLTRMRSIELERSTTAIEGFDYRRFDRMVQKWRLGLGKHDCTVADFTAGFAGTCFKLYKPIHSLIPSVTSLEQRQARHTLRIAIKKSRYFYEIAAQVLEHDYSAILGLLKEYQTILGRMNDIAEFSKLCSNMQLSRREHRCIGMTLQAEEERLLQELSGLITQHPLLYTPLFQQQNH